MVGAGGNNAFRANGTNGSKGTDGGGAGGRSYLQRQEA